jgi:hypothetical protein
MNTWPLNTFNYPLCFGLALLPLLVGLLLMRIRRRATGAEDNRQPGVWLLVAWSSLNVCSMVGAGWLGVGANSILQFGIYLAVTIAVSAAVSAFAEHFQSQRGAAWRTVKPFTAAWLIGMATILYLGRDVPSQLDSASQVIMGSFWGSVITTLYFSFFAILVIVPAMILIMNRGPEPTKRAGE